MSELSKYLPVFFNSQIVITNLLISDVPSVDYVNYGIIFVHLMIKFKSLKSYLIKKSSINNNIFRYFE
ncbi:MAG: hypothetical protein DRI94_14285 [Bacteroidetes bacterium]|nr:MAG: hypothetical protein DRI94_14285 [Bacteroidota bacterium]